MTSRFYKYDMSFATKYAVYDKKLMTFEIKIHFCHNLVFETGSESANSIRPCPVSLPTLVEVDPLFLLLACQLVNCFASATKTKIVKIS